MYLIFVRHGKPSYVVDEFTRPLSQEGKDELREFFPELRQDCAATIPGFENLSKAVLSSPKQRALDTAVILSESFALAPPETDDSLINHSLKRALRAAEQTGAELVFLVGHDPMCSMWVSELTWRPVEFSKGAAACVDYSAECKEAQTLLWYLTP